MERDGQSRAGMIISCLLMSLCGGLLVLTMRQLPQPQTGAGPREADSNVPDQKLRFVTCDVRRLHLQNEPVLAEIKRLNPDYLILQNIAESDAKALADSLQMRSAFRSFSSWADGSEGNCVLSKSMLSAAQPAADIGLWTTSQAVGKSFMIGSINASASDAASVSQRLVADWQQRGSPPTVLAGHFPPDIADHNPVQIHSGWFDGLSAWQRILPHSPASEAPSQIFLSSGWSCRAGGTVSGNALTASWIDASSSASATDPTTQAATRPADE